MFLEFAQNLIIEPTHIQICLRKTELNKNLESIMEETLRFEEQEFSCRNKMKTRQ